MFEIGALISTIQKVRVNPGVNLNVIEELGLTALCRFFDDGAYDDGSGEYAEPQRWSWYDAVADTGIPAPVLKDFITFVEKYGGWNYHMISEQDAEGFHLFSIATQTLGYRDTLIVPAYANTPEDEIPF